MDKRKSAPADEAKSARGSGSVFPDQYSTKKATVASILCGSDCPMTAQEIMAALDVSDPRLITKEIERERRAGLPICASNDSKRPGYFMATTPRELESYTRSLRRRVKAVSGTLAAMEETHDKWTGQQRLDLNGGDLE